MSKCNSCGELIDAVKPNQNLACSECSSKEAEADYYFNDSGLMVFTRTFHLKRGYCCQKGCLHCPYGTMDK